MQGRVFAIVQIIDSGIMPLPMIVFGPLADIISIQILIIITGILFCMVPLSLKFDKKLNYEPLKKEI